MNILTTNKKGGPSETIQQYMKKSLTSTELELEWIYGSHPRNTLSKPEFLKVLNDLRQNYKFIGESNNLDIRYQYVKLEKSGLTNIRCTIPGVQNIKQYCKTNSIVDIPATKFMKKESNKDDKNPSLTFKQIVNTDYNFRINLKKEVDLKDDDPEVIKFKDNLKDGLKYYRYKKRFSFVTNDNLFRIDLTAVKSNSYNPKRRTYNLAKNLVDSRILTGREIYELEVEYIGYQMKNDTYPIVDFSKKAYAEWSEEGMSEEDYKAQVALVTQKNSDTFSPDGDNYYVDEDNSGYDFISEYEGIDELDVPEPVVTETVSLMVTPWSKAASLKGEHIDLIYMNYWHPDKQWLFWGIMENKKEILFDGVKENFTADYDGAPENETYVKYAVYPFFSEDDKKREDFPEDFDNTFYVPFSLIQGLERTIDSSMKAGTPGWGPKGKPAWGPKGDSKLSKDNRLIDLVNLKFNGIIAYLLKILSERNLLVSGRKRNDILEEYKTLTEQNSERVNFIGPQPVSMGLSMIDPDNPHSILNGYVVTEKADGIRCELFIDKSSDGYLITQKTEIIPTGLTFKGKGSCILDGEYITLDRKGNPINLFMIFDIYYMDSGDYPNQPYTLPWLPKKKGDLCRSSILHDFKTHIEIKPASLLSLRDGIYSYLWSNEDKTVSQKDTIRIGYKQYYEGPKVLKTDKKDPTKYTNLNGMGKVSKKILDLDKKDNYEYSIDGLIYMPMYYSVGSNNEEIIKDNISGTWYQNYKWKPPEENTIDFRVKFVKEEIKGRNVNKISSFTKKGKTIKCRQVELYVGYDIKKDITTDFTWKVMGHDNRKQSEILFNPPSEKDSIHICNIQTTKDKLLCLKDKTEVQDGQIYEMRYEPTNPFGFQWIPLRVRDDKKRPNDSSTADNVWLTIQYPVTEEMIKGKFDLSKIQKTEEISDEKPYAYYVENPDSDADIALRQFHNYLKDRLINSMTSLGSKPISIMDTSIGRGGDIGKYMRSTNPISFLMAVDISPDVNKAAKNFYLKGGNKPKALFLQYDTSKSISGGEGCVGDHVNRNKLMIDILYDRQKALPKEMRTLVPKFKGLCKKGFDLISSQFSIHYYFSDELTLRTYIQNISENLKTGGHFIGTCYDGMKVFQRLNDLKNGHLEMIDEFGNKVYSITKKYEIDDFTYAKDDREKLFGQEIDVYMNSIGKVFTEYLVNFELFIDIMKEYDLVLAKPDFKKDYKGLFGNSDLCYTDGFGGFESMINQLDKLYSKDLSLKQHFPEAFQLLKEKNSLLRELSGFNNWFIFEKK